jgi:hypothetical protein
MHDAVVLPLAAVSLIGLDAYKVMYDAQPLS